MPVQYVKDFTFAPSPPRPTIRGYARGGLVKASTPFAYAKGGSVATDKVKTGAKTPWNADDATSPGSSKRTAPPQGEKNKAAASNKFATEGRNTPVATKQDGDVERMSGYSDFKKGGSTNRLKNLGHYAHGGKVRPTKTEVKSGTPSGGKVKAPVKPTKGASKVEKHAGTPKTAPGSRVEMKGGVAKAAMGGLSRGTSHAKNAAIHAKSAHKPKGPSLGALAGALSGAGMPQQGPQAPPGMSPGMGAPPGGQMGAIAPQAPTMGGGPPAMSHGGGVKHVIVHHVSHR